jgi:acetyl-CoA synthetase
MRAMPDRYDELYAAYRWQVPERYNIAQACCGQWAADPGRIALHWEDESGATARLSFADIQREANRLSNALAGLGVQRGDRVAILLPQRPETAIAYVAIFQMGAIAVPLSHLFGPDALEYRMEHAEVSVALVEPTTIANLWAVRGKLSHLRHVIGVGGAREAGVHAWEDLLAKAGSTFAALDTHAEDPALIIYTSARAGAPPVPPPGGRVRGSCSRRRRSDRARQRRRRRRAPDPAHPRAGCGSAPTPTTTAGAAPGSSACPVTEVSARA